MAEASPLEFYLIPQPNTTVFTGLVSATPSDPYITISYSSGITGSFGAPIAGQTVEFVGRGFRRLRSWSGGASGTLKIDESDDVGPTIQSGDSIKIYTSFRLWPKYPRFVQSGTNVTIFEDYDEPFTNQTNLWRPVANAGPVGVGFIEGGQAQVKFVGDRSFAVAPGATITSYLWTARNSAEGTSSSQGTEASPVIFTWTTPGWHLVYLQVTDSNGQTHTNYTWVVIIDLAFPTETAFLNFDANSDNYDFEQGGGECSFTAYGNATTTDFPEEALVVHAARGNITTATGSWPFRTNVLFSGWILSDTVRQNPGKTGGVSFRAAGVDAIMRNLTMFPVSLTDKNTPVEWTQGKQLTVDRVASYLWHYRSTLSLMTPIRPSTYSGLIRRQDFGPGDMYSQLQNELMRSIWGNLVCDHQGVLHHVIDYNLQNATERATATTRKTLHKGVWVDDVIIEERSDYQWPANQVKMSGVYYPGGEIDDICPLFSEAPGDAPKAYGKETNYDRLILLSQSDLNVRSGHALDKLNEQYRYRQRFVNDGSFTIAPQELFPANIESGDNDRGISFTGNLIPRRISRTYNHEGGFFTVDVDFEPETSGNPGATVDMPCGPPEQKLPIQPPVPGGPDTGPAALATVTTGSSFYFAPGLEQIWERRVTGLVDPDELAFHDMIKDPWSTFKQGYNPQNVILWGVGKGFLQRTTDSGQEWNGRAVDVPAWPGETGTPLSSVDLIRQSGDIFNEDRHYLLARWRYTGAYHGAVAKSEDGFNFTWHNLTGTAQARPMGLSVDRGNPAKLYVTAWEDNGTGIFYLRQYDTVDMSLDGRYDLGQVSSSEVDNQVYFASPFNQLGQTDEVFIFGRMNNPQALGSGTVHVLKNTNAGQPGSYSVIENSWGDDLCGSFGADEDGNFYAVRNGSG